jgi:hypothetical protein
VAACAPVGLRDGRGMSSLRACGADEGCWRTQHSERWVTESSSRGGGGGGGGRPPPQGGGGGLWGGGENNPPPGGRPVPPPPPPPPPPPASAHPTRPPTPASAAPADPAVLCGEARHRHHPEQGRDTAAHGPRLVAKGHDRAAGARRPGGQPLELRPAVNDAEARAPVPPRVGVRPSPQQQAGAAQCPPLPKQQPRRGRRSPRSGQPSAHPPIDPPPASNNPPSPLQVTRPAPLQPITHMNSWCPSGPNLHIGSVRVGAGLLKGASSRPMGGCAAATALKMSCRQVSAQMVTPTRTVALLAGASGPPPGLRAARRSRSTVRPAARRGGAGGQGVKGGQ